MCVPEPVPLDEEQKLDANGQNIIEQILSYFVSGTNMEGNDQMDQRPLNESTGIGFTPPELLREDPRSPLIDPNHVLQGLEVVWSDEESDVLLLRLNNELPEDSRPYYLGWDATGAKLGPGKYGCVHHASGDIKKLSLTDIPPELRTWVAPEASHWAVQWTNGATESGSSGATLVEASSGLGLGVLTGMCFPLHHRSSQEGQAKSEILTSELT